MLQGKRGREKNTHLHADQEKGARCHHGESEFPGSELPNFHQTFTAH
jgi:hypothetical protein